MSSAFPKMNLQLGGRAGSVEASTAPSLTLTAASVLAGGEL